MPRTHGHLDSDDTNEAAWVAARGATVGAARWGIYSAVAAGLAWYYSPVYRGLTIQFKVFLQMSGMAMGSMIEADNRLRAHEVYMRQQAKLKRDAAVWRRYEQELEELGTPGIGSDAGAGKGKIVPEKSG